MAIKKMGTGFAAYLLVMFFIAPLSFGQEDESETRRVIGFKYGVGYYAQLNDNRLEGYSNNFSLIIPIDAKFSASIYHESGNIDGTQDGKTFDAAITINELRVLREILSKNALSSSIFLGCGNGSISGDDIDDSSLVADIGAELAFVKKGKTAEAKLSVDFLYRHFKITSVEDILTESIDDLGGFILSLNLSVLF